MQFPKQYFISIQFTCIKRISNLRFYQGAYWNALFRDLLQPYLLKKLADENVWVLPNKNGYYSYKEGDIVSVTLIFPDSIKSIIEKVIFHLENKEYSSFSLDPFAHFVPGKTIEYKDCICLRCGKQWSSDNCLPLQEKDLEIEVKKLLELDSITLLFPIPLRLKRPQDFKDKKGGHSYFDSEYFKINTFLEKLALSLVSEKILLEKIFKQIQSIKSQILHSHFIWFDMKYHKEVGKSRSTTIGGIIGGIKIRIKLNKQLAQLMAYGQYFGLGEKRTFGFGFYRIPELDSVRKLKYIHYGKSFLEEVVNEDNLYYTLCKMKNHSPGMDSLTVTDLKKAGKDYLIKLSEVLKNNQYEPGDSIIYKRKKSNGELRYLYIHNVSDRLIFKAISNYFGNKIDPLLSNSSFAYRKGLNIRQAARKVRSLILNGYTTGFQGDISSFFDSVSLEKLFLLLQALFYKEPLIITLQKIFDNSKGLPQGNPISPVLSNLYLHQFDQIINKNKLKLVRYGDDFVILSKHSHTEKDIKNLVVELLNKLGLSLNTSKIVPIEENKPIDFLGFNINRKSLEFKSSFQKKENEFQWLPVFRYNFREGTPLYITFHVRYCRNDGNYIVLERENDINRIAWSDIHRIVVVGRARISAGVIRKALILRKPIVFMSILGHPIGSFSPDKKLGDISNSFNTQFIDFSTFRLNYIQNIVKAKIRNQRMLLQKNNIKEKKMLEIEKSIDKIDNIEKIRGKEGYASSLYFSYFRQLVSPFPFKRREFHPPKGPVNVMLSLGYSILYFRIAECLMSHNINPYNGLYHIGRGNHYALASDLVESFRIISDRITLTLIRKKQVASQDFYEIQKRNNTYTRMSGDCFKKYIHRFEWIMNQTITIEENEKIQYCQLFDETVKQLIRSLKLGLEFTPFRIR
ncbi:MAG: CRISPR-associated endonuclease Cas1 [Candidatus Cloacimonetes bacterium]|nr:CRISPR-associated endonuclease Cas1 [Candidatus Cloacimonadota bacterium]